MLLTTVNDEAAVPPVPLAALPNLTEVTVFKFVPFMVSTPPIAILAKVNEVIVGACAKALTPQKENNKHKTPNETIFLNLC